MKVLYPKDPLLNLKDAVFLAGPATRSSTTLGWREEMIKTLSNQGFNGTILNPENTNYGSMNAEEYSAQTLWEQDGMKLASYLIFWIPRSKEHPGFTTNIELGAWLEHPRTYIGWPSGSWNNQYISERCRKIGKKVYGCMEELVSDIVISQNRPYSIFFTSDTHFGIDRTLESTCRPYENTRDMDLMLSSNWNKLVRSSDYVFHLGDFGDWRAFQNLNCKKMYCIPGNHDLDWEDKRVEFIQKGKKVRLNGREYRLVHEPVGGSLFSGNRDDFYLFGHIHRTGVVKENGINVGVDNFRYSPVNLKEVEYLRDGIEKGYMDENVFSRRVIP